MRFSSRLKHLCYENAIFKKAGNNPDVEITVLAEWKPVLSPRELSPLDLVDLAPKLKYELL